jgi:hypothetical protein
MLRVGLVVMASMMVLGLITASDVAAAGAHPEVNPGRTNPDAVLTAVGTGSYVGKFVRDMGAIVRHAGQRSGPALVDAPIILVM